jgi:hypothetical protein
LEERYGDHAGYVQRLEQAVKKLVAKAKNEETAKRFAR